MTVCVCKSVCVSSEAKPKREAVPLKQNWKKKKKKCLQASYYSGMSQGSGFAAQLYKPGRIWLIRPGCRSVKRSFRTRAPNETAQLLWVLTGRRGSRELVAGCNTSAWWRLLAAGSDLSAHTVSLLPSSIKISGALFPPKSAITICCDRGSCDFVQLEQARVLGSVSSFVCLCSLMA